MSSRAVRVALAMLMVAAIVGAAYVTWKEHLEAGDAARAARQFEHQTRLASRSLLEVKSAQTGYVAAGQGEDYWITRVETLLGASRDAVTVLRTHADSPETGTEVESALAALEDFEQMDRRARDYARNGQRLLASDLVFSEGIEKIDAAIAALDRARELETGSLESSVRESRREQFLATAGAAAVGLLVVFLLMPVRRAAAPVEVRKPAPVEPAADYPIARRRDRPAPPQPAAAPAPAVVAQLPASPPPVPPPAPRVDLQAIASLCTDLGRVLDTRALPAALERAAAVLDASGIVLWIVDPDGRELAAVIAHGYPQNLVARMGAIERDAENVTAAAFRTGVVQTVKADAVSPGAIAAPLLTPSGAVGVMAAEVLHDGERHEATRAAAAIIAAQLATLMGPPSSRSHGTAEVAGA